MNLVVPSLTYNFAYLLSGTTTTSLPYSICAVGTFITGPVGSNGAATVYGITGTRTYTVGGVPTVQNIIGIALPGEDGNDGLVYPGTYPYVDEGQLLHLLLSISIVNISIPYSYPMSPFHSLSLTTVLCCLLWYFCV